MGWFTASVIVRLIRAFMVEALEGNYIKMARIKGVPEWRVVWKHGLINAASPLMAALPTVASLVMMNAVIIEVVFAWPARRPAGVQSGKCKGV